VIIRCIESLCVTSAEPDGCGAVSDLRRVAASRLRSCRLRVAEPQRRKMRLKGVWNSRSVEMGEPAIGRRPRIGVRPGIYSRGDSRTVGADAEAYGNQFPAYRANPMAETLRAVDGLANDPTYSQQYEEYQRNMVYGDRVDFAACLSTLKELAEQMFACTNG
jgi:hypothetical protein